jgi:hypothetical protein
MISIVGAIGVINSVLLGVTAGFAVATLIGDELWATTPVGLGVFVIAVPLHQRYQKAQRQRAHDLDDLFAGQALTSAGYGGGTDR